MDCLSSLSFGFVSDTSGIKYGNSTHSDSFLFIAVTMLTCSIELEKGNYLFGCWVLVREIGKLQGYSTMVQVRGNFFLLKITAQMKKRFSGFISRMIKLTHRNCITALQYTARSKTMDSVLWLRVVSSLHSSDDVQIYHRLYDCISEQRHQFPCMRRRQIIHFQKESARTYDTCIALIIV